MVTEISFDYSYNGIGGMKENHISTCSEERGAIRRGYELFMIKQYAELRGQVSKSVGRTQHRIVFDLPIVFSRCAALNSLARLQRLHTRDRSRCDHGFHASHLIVNHCMNDKRLMQRWQLARVREGKCAWITCKASDASSGSG